MRNFPMHLWRTLGEYDDAPALIEPAQAGVEQTSYKDWMRRIRRLAIGLMEEGLEPGQRIGLVSTNCTEWLTFAVAAWTAGACLVPLVPNQDRRATLRKLARSGAEWIVVRDRAGLDHVRGQGGDLPEHLRWVVFAEDAIPDAATIYTLRDLFESGRYRELRGGDKQLAKRMFALAEDQANLILFDPLEDQDPHGAFFDSPRMARLCEDLGEDLFPNGGTAERLAVSLSYGWFHATLASVAALMQGATLVTGESHDSVYAAMAQLGPTRLVAGPAFLEEEARKWRARIEAAPDFLKKIGGAEEMPEGFSFTRALGALGERAAERTLYEPIRQDLGNELKTIHVVAGKIDPATRDLLDKLGIAPLGIYGWPEAGVTHLERAGARRPDAVGRPIQGVACKIAGSKTGEETVGEILVRADGVMVDYWDGEGPRRIEDGWLHTGDLGIIRTGFLHLVEPHTTASEEE